MRESVSGILIFEDEFFIIQRQNYLKAFPGYFSFPGGKVDKEDRDFVLDLKLDGVEDYLLVSLKRELKEELGVDIEELFKQKVVTNICRLGEAITPDFNPHRFKNHYFKIFLSKKIDIQADSGEAQFSGWIKAEEGFDRYQRGELLVVPPMISIFEDLKKDINSMIEIDPNLKYDGTKEVPLIKPVGGLNQYLPLSNTFPPANRTNCFLIGDEKRVLIDPSPKCLEEYEKLKYSLKEEKIDLIFLTHHHPDHHQFAPELARELSLPMMMSSDTQGRLLEKCGSDYFSNIDIILAKDGDILTSSQGHEVEILETPGHDEGQLTLVRADRAWAIVSDLIQTVGTVVIGGDEGDMNKYFRSLERVIKLSPRNIFPSHGIGIGGVNKLKFTLKHRLERELQVESLLNKGRDREAMLAEIYPDLPERLHKYALLTIDAHITKIQSVGIG